MIKKKMYMIILVIFLVFLGVTFLFILRKKTDKLIQSDLNNIDLVSITEWYGTSKNISDRNSINNIIDYLNSLKIKLKSFDLRNPKEWSIRIGFYNDISDDLSMMDESIFITRNGTVYKDNIVYQIEHFDYDYLKSILFK